MRDGGYWNPETVPLERAACQQPGPGDATGRSRETQPFVRVLLPPSDPCWAKNTIGGPEVRSPRTGSPLVSESTGRVEKGGPVSLEGQTEHSPHKNALTQPPTLKGPVSRGTAVGEL